MPPVEPAIRCILRSTKGDAIESVLPVRRPATITVVLAPISCVRRCGALKYIFFCGFTIFIFREKIVKLEVSLLIFHILDVHVLGAVFV